MPCVRGFAEDLEVPGSQLGDRHSVQIGDLFGDVQHHDLRAPFMCSFAVSRACREAGDVNT
jgi:hypothetical protein